MTRPDIRFVALVTVMLLLGVGIAIDPFETVSFGRRSAAGLVVGPLALAYALFGLRRRNFEELSGASLDRSPAKFWFCAIVFLLLGIGALTVGLLAVADLG